MLSDTDRLTQTVEQVLRAGRAGDKKAGRDRAEVDFGQIVRECMDAILSQHHLQPEALRLQAASVKMERGLKVPRQRTKICAQPFSTFSIMR